ncbi:nitrate- and nitrite sensing domain-containing protein [Sphaerisporangium sp. NPDC051017]|uniref:sensor histidine kinase n=1 Tax=Sphaerisporangium sp. NPDC051017 TaxID=3154636 RepID=UPI00343DB81B
MGSGKRSIRFKIFSLLLLPLLSLSALWGFVLNLTIGDGISLARANTTYQGIGVTSTDLGLQLQAERMLSVSRLSTSAGDVDRLAAQRHTTDLSLARFEAEVTRQSGDTIGMEDALDALQEELRQLPALRANVDTEQTTRLDIAQSYNHIMDAMFHVYDRMSSVPDLTIFEQAGALLAMGNAREYISRENALVLGALSTGRLSDAEYAALADWAANRRAQYARGMATFDPELRKPYEEVFATLTFKRFQTMEQDLINRARAGAPLPPSVKAWRPITDNLSAILDEVGLKSSRTMASRAQSVATGILVRIGLAGGLGLVAVIASIIISVRFGRRLVRDLGDLRDSARELADVRLPHVVARLRRGEEVDVEADAPDITGGDSAETADVARAFGSVRHTAVQAAVEQANLRRGVGQVFLNLARRKQGLLHRQLTLLDAMQRRAADPDALRDLFQLDHLTTRMRRHAESLIILSGAAPGRAWRKPVPVVDIVRAAVAEVEDYTRVTVMPLPNAHLSGNAVTDLIHLIAELIENATIFSPPQTRVQVRGEVVANGFAVEIEDRGLGMAPHEYDAVNERLAHPPEFDLADSDRLGLFVVGQLAARNGVSVILRASAYGGTTAIVLIPKTLVADDGSPSPIPGSLADVVPSPGPLTAPPAPSTPSSSAWQTPALTAGPAASADEPKPSMFFTPPTSRAPESTPSLTVVPGIADTGPIGPPVPAKDAPERPAPRSTSTGTHRGLPRRVRQANMAPQLRETTGPLSAPTPAEATPLPRRTADATGSAERSPEDARAMFAAFQQGGRRGRLEAEEEVPEMAADGPRAHGEPLSSHDGENTPPTGASESDAPVTIRPDQRDQRRDLRNHSDGYVHLTNGEKGDE